MPFMRMALGVDEMVHDGQPPSRYVRAEDALWRDASGTVIIAPPAQGELLELGGTGVALWHLLAAPVTVAEMVRDLSRTFGAPVSDVRRDIELVLGDLVRRGAVTEVDVT